MHRVQLAFARNLKNARENKRMTQNELSEKAEIALRTYQKYEQGTLWPSPDVIEAISDALRISVAKLFDDEANAPAKIVSDLTTEELVGFLPSKNSPQEDELLSLFRQVTSDDGRSSVIDFARNTVKLDKGQRIATARKRAKA